MNGKSKNVVVITYAVITVIFVVAFFVVPQALSDKSIAPIKAITTFFFNIKSSRIKTSSI